MRTRAPLLVVLSLAACGGGMTDPSPMAPPPAAPPAPVTTPMPAAPSPSPEPVSDEPVVLRTARIFGANGHSASGSARIVRWRGRHQLELGSDFRIDSGNNDVYLTNSDRAPLASDLNLGSMHATRGHQVYELPDDGSRFAYVMLWCRPFRVPIGIGELR